jgi:hypothetical protein
VANRAIGVGTFTLKNLLQCNAIYLSKNNDGINVAHHSRFTYWGALFPNLLGAHSTTINDANVLHDYHDILIPKAVAYSAGLLDYYFRGSMSVAMSWNVGSGYTFTNVNTSSQDFMGGNFLLLAQSTNNVRTIVQTNQLLGILSPGNSTNITFSGTVSPGTTFTVVYQGTIGQSNNIALDPADTNIAIAVATASVNQVINYTNDVLLSILGLPDGATIETNLASADFPFPITGSYGAIVNYANFDDKGTIGSIQSSGPQISCSFLCEITNTVVPSADISITPDGYGLSVPVTATDDAGCGVAIGWRVITITWWAAKPAQ